MGSFKNQLEKEMLLSLTPVFQNFQGLGHSSGTQNMGFWVQFPSLSNELKPCSPNSLRHHSH